MVRRVHVHAPTAAVAASTTARATTPESAHGVRTLVGGATTDMAPPAPPASTDRSNQRPLPPSVRTNGCTFCAIFFAGPLQIHLPCDGLKETGRIGRRGVERRLCRTGATGFTGGGLPGLRVVDRARLARLVEHECRQRRGARGGGRLEGARVRDPRRQRLLERSEEGVDLGEAGGDHLESMAAADKLVALDVREAVDGAARASGAARRTSRCGLSRVDPMECVFGGFCRLCYGLGASWWCQRRCTPQGLARQWAWTPGGVHGFLVDGLSTGPRASHFGEKGVRTKPTVAARSAATKKMCFGAVEARPTSRSAGRPNKKT